MVNTIDDKIVITNSDRQSFKKCRRKHRFESHLYGNLQPREHNVPLLFGTLIHGALEDYYTNVTRAFGLRSFKIGPFTEHAYELELLPQVRELGEEMMNNYGVWAPTVDEFEVKSGETKFEVPIPVYKDHPVEKPFWPKDGYLMYEDFPVVYRGIVDLIVEEQDGIWIMDHKTTKQFDNDWFLQTDEQITSYIWALQIQEGYDIQGGYYNELLKQAPEPVEPMAKKRDGRKFSTNRRNKVILNDFLIALDEHDEEYDLYEDYIDFLEKRGNPYFRRTQMYRTKNEVENVGFNIFKETQDMLTAYPYPNPNKLNCNGCAFKSPCRDLNDNRDISYTIKSFYTDKVYKTVE